MGYCTRLVLSLVGEYIAGARSIPGYRSAILVYFVRQEQEGVIIVHNRNAYQLLYYSSVANSTMGCAECGSQLMRLGRLHGEAETPTIGHGVVLSSDRVPSLCRLTIGLQLDMTTHCSAVENTFNQDPTSREVIQTKIRGKLFRT